ncbi:MAG: GNAT family N-acetyltransferase [Deltaproteobacteria bacterium]
MAEVYKMTDFSIRPLRRPEIDAVSALFAHAMRDNPIYVRIFGDDAQGRVKMLRKLNCAAVSRIISVGGEVLGAERAGVIVGALGMSPPGGCALSFLERLKAIPSVIGYPLPVIIRLRRWMMRWSDFDLREPHWHLGPLAVETALQGGGIGTRILDACLREMDEKGAVSYLETDKLINVKLYRRLGFEVVREAQVLGVVNWFMRRAPSGGMRDL